MVTPAARRSAVAYTSETHSVSERHSCRLLGVGRSTVRYRSTKTSDHALKDRLQVLANDRPRFGYRRLYLLLRREFGSLNHKRVYRLYKEADLAVRRRRRKRVATGRKPLPTVDRPGVVWTMDFVRDTLANGRPFRTLNVLDVFTRQCLAIEVDTSLPGQRVTRVLDGVAIDHGLPETIRVDNGPEFAGKVLDAWAYDRGVRLDFITPGKPIENAHVESFNGKFRDECLNQHWFTDLADARAIIAAWRHDYNAVRPHSALGNLTPERFAQLPVPTAGLSL